MADDPFTVARAQSTDLFADAKTSTARDPFAAARTASSADPFARASAAFGNGVHASGTLLERLGVPRVIDLLSRPGKAGTAFFAGDEPGKVAHAFTSGDPSQYATDVDRVKQHLGVKHGGIEERLGARALDSDRLPAWGRGLLDFGVETATDPTTIVGGDVARGAGSAASLAGRAAASGMRKTSVGSDVLDVGRGVIDAFTFGGGAKRELGSERYHGAIAADNRQAAREAEGSLRLSERYDATFGKLNDDDKHTAFQILNGERQATDPASGRLIVPQHVAQAASDGRKLLNDAAALQADATGRRRLGYNLAPLANRDLAPRVEPWQLSYATRAPGRLTRSENAAAPSLMSAMTHADDVQRASGGARRLVGRVDRAYTLPDELRDFAAPDNQGILGARNLRRNYLPGPRAPIDPAAKPARPQPFNLLRPFAPNLISRDEFATAKDDVPALEDAFRRALGSAARQGTAGRLRDEVGAPLSLNARDREPTALEQLFEVTPRAEGAARTRSEKAADLAHGVVNVPKNVVTAFGLKHGLINVPVLAGMSEGPGAALEALVRGAQLARKAPGNRYEALRTGIEGGVISPFDDRANPIADTFSKLVGRVPTAVRTGSGAALGGFGGEKADEDLHPNATPAERATAALVGALTGGALGRVAPQIPKGTNALTWAIDDAAKQAVLRRKLARGMTPAEAAGQTLREMIDYRHRSAATKALSNVAPFATFRSRLPAAVASSVSRTPAKALGLDRSTQGLATNGTVDVRTPDGRRHTPVVSNPLSDAISLVEEPQKYARAMMADPIRAALSGAAMTSEHFDRRTGKTVAPLKPHYFTYGEPLLPHHDPVTGKPKAGFAASQVANYLPFAAGDAIMKATGTNEFPAEDWLSTLLGGALGVHVR